MSVKVGEIWDTVPGSGLCVSPRRFGPPRRCGPQTGVSLDLVNRPIDGQTDGQTGGKKSGKGALLLGVLLWPPQIGLGGKCDKK